MGDRRPFIEVARAGLGADDLRAVLAIERQAFSIPWSEQSLTRESGLHFSQILVARERPGALLVGYACRWRIESEVQLLKVAVDPRCRRQGIGRELVAAICREAFDLGATVTLEVDRSNSAAVALYEALGFWRVGERRHYYGRGRHALLMATRRRCANGLTDAAYLDSPEVAR